MSELEHCLHLDGWAQGESIHVSSKLRVVSVKDAVSQHQRISSNIAPTIRQPREDLSGQHYQYIGTTATVVEYTPA